jgi:hypothetical protein
MHIKELAVRKKKRNISFRENPRNDANLDPAFSNMFFRIILRYLE